MIQYYFRKIKTMEPPLPLIRALDAYLISNLNMHQLMKGGASFKVKGMIYMDFQISVIFFF